MTSMRSRACFELLPDRLRGGDVAAGDDLRERDRRRAGVRGRGEQVLHLRRPTVRRARGRS